MAFDGEVLIKLQGSMTTTRGRRGSTKVDVNSFRHAKLTNGGGANQASLAYDDEITIAAASNEDLDLSGALVPAAGGGTIDFSKIKALYITASADNPGPVTIGGHDTAAWAPMFGDPADTLSLPPGHTFAWLAPDAAGLAVAAGTADQLRLTNPDAEDDAVVEVVIFGA